MHFPIPDIMGNLRKMTGAKVISTMDLSNGFHQMYVDYASSLVLAFVLDIGTFRFVTVPQGLATAPAMFNQWVSSKFRCFC